MFDEKYYHCTTADRAARILKTGGEFMHFTYNGPDWRYSKQKCLEDGSEPACVVLDLTAPHIAELLAHWGSIEETPEGIFLEHIDVEFLKMYDENKD